MKTKVKGECFYGGCEDGLIYPRMDRLEDVGQPPRSCPLCNGTGTIKFEADIEFVDGFTGTIREKPPVVEVG